MKKRLRIISIFMLCFAMWAGLFIPAFAAGADEFTAGAKGEITGIANRGLWGEHPENSQEAFSAAHAAGLDLVLADVSVTSDGIPVLLEAHSAARMLGCEQPDAAQYTYEALAALKLRAGAGGNGNETTEYTVPKLETALQTAAAEGYTLVLKFDASLTPQVMATAKGKTCVLYPTGKTKAVLAAVDEIGGAFPVIAEKRSNVIFSVLSFVNKLKAADAAGAVLKTTNRYGVIYYKSTLKHCDTIRVIADTSDAETAGWREDTAKWWDDLISRGYNTIITDDPEAFAAYLKENNAARERLNTLYETAKNKKLPQFGSPLASDYKKNYTDAMDTAAQLLADASCSTQELRDAYTALKSAGKAIDMNYAEIDAGTAGSTLTLPRILLCAGAAAIVILVQVYFYKKRKAEK